MLTNKTIFRIVDLIDELHQAQLHSNRIYLLLPWTLSFCHNSQFFIDFLFGACVRLFVRWRGLFNVSHATRIHKTRWNCINFHCCFDLEVVFFFLSLGILPCGGACANNNSSAPMCLFSSFFHCILEFSTQWHWHYKSNWLDDLNSGSAFSYFEKKRTKINTLD